MTVLPSSHPAQSLMRFDLPPGAKGSPLHFHSTMAETFTVLQGSLEMELGGAGQWQRLRAGESVHVPAGMAHSFRNTSSEWVAFTSANTPATGFNRFIRGLYGLAIDGRVNSDGMPTNPLLLAVLLQQADTVPVGIPLWLYRGLLSILVTVARLTGADRSLAKYWLH